MSSSCQTSYTSKSSLSNGQKQTLVALNLLSMAVNIVTNSAVITSLKRTNQLQNISLRLILFLSISDLCLALVSQTLFTVMLSNFSDKDHCEFDSIVNFFAIFLTHTSGYTIVLIGYDRFARMKYLNKYSVIVTKRRVHIALVVFTLLSLTQASLYPIGTMYSIFPKTKIIAVFIDVIIGGAALCLYIATIFIIKRHRRNAQNRQLLENVDKAVTRLASLILLAIIIFYIPYMLISVSHSVLSPKLPNIHKRQTLHFVLFFGYVLTYCNSSVNAIIFLCVNGKAKNFISRKLCRQDDVEESTLSNSGTPTITQL